MLIITGTGRSGTATLARLLGGHHEFRVNYILEKYFVGQDPHADLFGRLEKRIRVVLDLHQGIDAPSFVDSSNLYIYFIDAIYKLNPSVKFILGVRDGRDFVRSAFTRGWHERKLFGTVPPYIDPYFPKWTEMTPIQKNAWIWTYRNTIALKGLKSLPPEQRLLIRIEDLAKPGKTDLIENFTGLKIKDKEDANKKYNADPSFDLPPKEEWSPQMNTEFLEIAGGLMRTFNYV